MITPYVYKGTHKITGQFYIGSRYTVKLKLPPIDDLLLYRTSSKVVRPIFDEFDWIVVAQFFTPEAAFDFEQEMIEQNWGNKLMLNKACYKNDIKRFMNGLKGKKLSEQHKQRISASHQGKTGHKHTEDQRRKMSEQRKGRASTRTGFHHTEEHKRLMSERQKGRKPKPESVLKWCKRFIVTDPDGKEYRIINLLQFCREHNLTNSSMTNVAKGKYSNHKGWRCRYDSDE